MHRGGSGGLIIFENYEKMVNDNSGHWIKNLFFMGVA